jgi:hypothetical protein
MKLKHNAIINGKWYNAFEPIDRDIVPINLRKYEAKETKPSSSRSVTNLRRQYNQQYHVNAENEMTVPAQRQAAMIETQNAEQDYIDQMSNEPPDEATEAALQELREEYYADVRMQAANAKSAAKYADELTDTLRQEADEKVESGEYDQIDTPFKPPPAKVSKPKSLFVKRQGRFVPASTAYWIPGEVLYWHRKRDIGVSDKCIKHSQVKGE